MTASAEGIVFGSPEFWELYDQFCTPTSLANLVKGESSPLAAAIQAIIRAAHLTREIHSLSRPERGWPHHKAWLALRSEEIQNKDGGFGLFMRAGDVVVVEHGWDRDVTVTHAPYRSLMSGTWEPMIGLFLPLFDRGTIMAAIELRLAANGAEALELARKEADDWGWP